MSLEEGEVLRLVLREDVVLHVVGIGLRPVLRRVGRIVAQQLVVEVEVDGVEAEAVARGQPKRMVESSHSCTSGLWKLKSGCSARKLCR